MPFSKDQIIGSIGSFLFVVIAFGGGWYYLDQQRVSALDAEKNAYKMKLEAEASLLRAQRIEQEVKAQELKVALAVEKHSRDKELSDLTLKFIDEVSDINFLQTCGDDPEHNAKARKANALLQLIEAKAKEYGREDIIESFVEKQRFGIGGWSAKCRP